MDFVPLKIWLITFSSASVNLTFIIRNVLDLRNIKMFVNGMRYLLRSLILGNFFLDVVGGEMPVGAFLQQLRTEIIGVYQSCDYLIFNDFVVLHVLHFCSNGQLLTTLSKLGWGFVRPLLLIEKMKHSYR